MKTSIIYQNINRNCGYYELTIKESEKSFIVIERTNWQGQYDKEIRFSKSEEMAKAVNDFINGRFDQFRDLYVATRDNGSYWQKWEKIY